MTLLPRINELRSIAGVVFATLLFSLPMFILAGTAYSENNIEFLDKQLIRELNFGIYEVVTPKLESDTIQYEKKLPFDQLDFIERNEKFYSIGTAFFINDNELMTAAHVFGLSYFSLLQNFFIRDNEGNLFPIKNIIKYSTQRDMVVFNLKTYPKKITPLPLNGEVEIGDTVFSVGNAQGEGIAYRAGQVASFTPEREYGKWKDIRFTSPASPGNSGGPLLNLHGKVVGLIVQKNQSENYNIAVPIAEKDNLTKGAEFHLRNVVVGLYGVDDTITKDWTYSFPLPATVVDVATGAQNDLNKHWSMLSDELSKKIEKQNYPLGERFRDFLRNQPYVKGIGAIVPSTNFKSWTMARGYGTKVPLTSTQNVYKSNVFFTDLQVIIEKPSGTSLKSFLDSPKIVMENLLKAISFTRLVGSEKIQITSLGEPVQKNIIIDKLGRRWISSLWNLPYSDSFVYSSCLPYPKGVICNLDTKQNANRKYGYFDNVHESYNEMVVGYEGEINDWVEYFSLGKEYLPKSFQKSSLAFNEDTLTVKTSDFTLNFKHPKIKGNSNIHFHLGYSIEELLKEELLLFEIFPSKGSKSNYRIQPRFEASPFNSDNYQTTWDSIKNQTDEFSGKIINKGDKQQINRAVVQTKTIITSPLDQQIEKVFTTGCYYKTTDEGIEEDCEDFSKSINFL